MHHVKRHESSGLLCIFLLHAFFLNSGAGRASASASVNSSVPNYIARQFCQHIRSSLDVGSRGVTLHRSVGGLPLHIDLSMSTSARIPLRHLGLDLCEGGLAGAGLVPAELPT